MAINDVNNNSENLGARRDIEEAHEPTSCASSQKAGEGCANNTKTVSENMGEGVEDVQRDEQIDESAVQADPTAIGANRDDFEK